VKKKGWWEWPAAQRRKRMMMMMTQTVDTWVLQVRMQPACSCRPTDNAAGAGHVQWEGRER